MKIDLTEIYKGLAEWRAERGITAESQKAGYIVNVMEELGELAQALRDYEKIKNGERALRAGTFDIKSTLGEMIIFEGTTKGEIEITLEKAEHEIIDALCDISVFTINAGADIPCAKKDLETHTGQLKASFAMLIEACAIFAQDKEYSTVDYIAEVKAFEYHIFFNDILHICACLAYDYGYNFEVAMIETIKEISSRTGAYDEKAKKWVKDESDEARAKWYKADYEKARIKQ